MESSRGESCCRCGIAGSMRPLMGSHPRLGGLSPVSSPLRRCQRESRLPRAPRGFIAHCKAQSSNSASPNRILLHARQALLAAAMSLAAVVGSPLEAQAKKAEPPPPPPTAYDVRFSSLPSTLYAYTYLYDHTRLSSCCVNHSACLCAGAAEDYLGSIRQHRIPA